MRLAHVYGPYASQFIATALCMARVYQHLQEEMKWLWSRDLRVNTVHIDDVVRGLWAVAAWYAAGQAGWDPATMGGRIPTFNMVDEGHTSQGIMAALIGDIFDIETGFQGTIISTFARLNLDSVVADVNDELLQPWADLLQDAGITRAGPISPFVEKELLKDTDLSMDGERFKSVVGFRYERPAITKVALQEVVESYKRVGWWPAQEMQKKE